MSNMKNIKFPGFWPLLKSQADLPRYEWELDYHLTLTSSTSNFSPWNIHAFKIKSYSKSTSTEFLTLALYSPPPDLTSCLEMPPNSLGWKMSKALMCLGKHTSFLFWLSIIASKPYGMMLGPTWFTLGSDLFLALMLVTHWAHLFY